MCLSNTSDVQCVFLLAILTSVRSLQVKRAGPRPADSERESQPASVTSSHTFGRGPRLYVGGVADAVSEEKVRQHFGRWGNVNDVYFPGVKGQKRPNYCFVTFENYRSSQRACDQSDRQIDGWVKLPFVIVASCCYGCQMYEYAPFCAGVSACFVYTKTVFALQLIASCSLMRLPSSGL